MGKRARNESQLVSGILRGVIALAIVAAGLYLAGSLWHVISEDTLPSAVGVDLDTADFRGELPDSASLTELRGTLDLTAGAGWRTTWWVFTAVPVGLGIAGLVILFRIVGDRDDPFTPTNVRRFAWLGGLAIAYLFVRSRVARSRWP